MKANFLNERPKRLKRLLAVIAFAPAASEVYVVGAPQALAQESPKGIIAAQLRLRGYPCAFPKSARRDRGDSKPDEAVWIMECGNALYRVRLIPNMAARIDVVSTNRRHK